MLSPNMIVGARLGGASDWGSEPVVASGMDTGTEHMRGNGCEIVAGTISKWMKTTKTRNVRYIHTRY